MSDSPTSEPSRSSPSAPASGSAGSAAASASLLQVAVGVVFRSDGAVLFGQRVPGKPYAGWWEFPGGKLEAGETVEQALARELDEELGLAVHESLPWVVREHLYPHAHVRLHFQRVTRWSGEPRSREGQAFVWQPPDAITVTPILPAALPVIEWLALPPQVVIVTEAGAGQRVQAMAAVVSAGADAGAVSVIGTGEISRDGAARAGARSRRWRGALCRTAAEVEQAAQDGLDLVVLPAAMSWTAFEALVRCSKLPVFTLNADAATARAHGAHGVATTAGGAY